MHCVPFWVIPGHCQLGGSSRPLWPPSSSLAHRGLADRALHLRRPPPNPSFLPMTVVPAELDHAKGLVPRHCHPKFSPRPEVPKSTPTPTLTLSILTPRRGRKPLPPCSSCGPPGIIPSPPARVLARVKGRRLGEGKATGGSGCRGPTSCMRSLSLLVHKSWSHLAG